MKQLVFVIGLAILLASHLSLMYVFGSAYGTEQKATYVTINKFGEANIELIMLLVALPFVLVFVKECYRMQFLEKELKER